MKFKCDVYRIALIRYPPVKFPNSVIHQYLENRDYRPKLIEREKNIIYLTFENRLQINKIHDYLNEFEVDGMKVVAMLLEGEYSLKGQQKLQLFELYRSNPNLYFSHPELDHTNPDNDAVLAILDPPSMLNTEAERKEIFGKFGSVLNGMMLHRLITIKFESREMAKKAFKTAQLYSMKAFLVVDRLDNEILPEIEVVTFEEDKSTNSISFYNPKSEKEITYIEHVENVAFIIAYANPKELEILNLEYLRLKTLMQKFLMTKPYVYKVLTDQANNLARVEQLVGNEMADTMRKNRNDFFILLRKCDQEISIGRLYSIIPSFGLDKGLKIKLSEVELVLRRELHCLVSSGNIYDRNQLVELHTMGDSITLIHDVYSNWIELSFVKDVTDIIAYNSWVVRYGVPKYFYTSLPANSFHPKYNHPVGIIYLGKGDRFSPHFDKMIQRIQATLDSTMMSQTVKQESIVDLVKIANQSVVPGSLARIPFSLHNLRHRE